MENKTLYMDFLAKYLKQNHTGVNNAVFSRELEELLQVGSRDIRRLVSDLREMGVPICSDTHRGYYYAESRDEIRGTLKGMEEHLASISKTMSRLGRAQVDSERKIRRIQIVITPENGPEEHIVMQVS